MPVQLKITLHKVGTGLILSMDTDTPDVIKIGLGGYGGLRSPEITQDANNAILAVMPDYNVKNKTVYYYESPDETVKLYMAWDHMTRGTIKVLVDANGTRVFREDGFPVGTLLEVQPNIVSIIPGGYIANDDGELRSFLQVKGTHFNKLRLTYPSFSFTLSVTKDGHLVEDNLSNDITVSFNEKEGLFVYRLKEGLEVTFTEYGTFIPVTVEVLTESDIVAFKGSFKTKVMKEGEILDIPRLGNIMP